MRRSKSKNRFVRGDRVALDMRIPIIGCCKPEYEEYRPAGSLGTIDAVPAWDGDLGQDRYAVLLDDFDVEPLFLAEIFLRPAPDRLEE